MANLLHRADCHASGSTPRYAVVAIPGCAEPLNLCAHCLHKHSARLRELEAIIEPLGMGTPAKGTGTEATPSHYAAGG